MSATLILDVEDAKELRSFALDGFKEIEREHVDERRWYSVHRLVFQKEGDPRFWAWTYDQPLTEEQEWPDLYAEDLEAVEVFPEQKTITVYVSRP